MLASSFLPWSRIRRPYCAFSGPASASASPAPHLWELLSLPGFSFGSSAWVPMSPLVSWLASLGGDNMCGFREASQDPGLSPTPLLCLCHCTVLGHADSYLKFNPLARTLLDETCAPPKVHCAHEMKPSLVLCCFHVAVQFLTYSRVPGEQLDTVKGTERSWGRFNHSNHVLI